MNKTIFSLTQTIKQLVQVALLLWLVLLAACMAQEETSPTSVLSIPIQETEIVQMAVTTPTITTTFEPTTTATALPTKPLTTPTIAVTPTAFELSATPTATNTPLPTATLTAAEQQQRWLMIDDRLAAVMTSNNGCQLPCWWGIEPGDTVAHARQIFNTIDETSWEDSPAQRGELKEIGYFRHRYRDEMGEMIHIGILAFLIAQDNQVTVFNTYVGRSVDFATDMVEYNQIGERLRRDWEQFSIQSMFETYGEPALIYILPNEPYYDVNIYYPNLGIAASYRSEISRNEQGERTICHNMLDIFNIRSMNLFLYDPLAGLPPGYVRATYQLWPLNPEVLVPEDRRLVELGSVENDTGMTIDKFVTFVLENEGKGTCFTVN